jgi:acyl carrier protein
VEDAMVEIKAKIKSFILAECVPGESAENLDDDLPLRANGILDSLSLLKLVSFVESEFRVEVDAHDVDDTNFGSINSVAAYVQNRRSALPVP